MTDFISSGSKSPCPVCGREKDADCSWVPDLSLVFCHTPCNPSSEVPNPGNDVNGYRFTGKHTQGGYCERAIYAPKDPFEKGVKPDTGWNATYFYYPDAEGNPLARVGKSIKNGKKMIWQEYWLPLKEFRRDLFKGIKGDHGWISVSLNKVKAGNATEEERKHYQSLVDKKERGIHLYRIEEARSRAHEGNLPILIIEGEPGVDRLLSLGIPATTAIGGAGKWWQYGGGSEGNYEEDLDGFEFVLCPDRDKPGVEHCDDVLEAYKLYCHQAEKDFVEPKWLYANPTSKAWQVPDVGSGYDIVNWIEELEKEGKRQDEIKETILSAIEPRRNFDLDVLFPQESPKESRKAVQQEIPSMKGSKPTRKEKLSFCQQALKDLYEGDDNHWICVDEKLHKWDGTYYKLCPEKDEIRRIYHYCNTYKVLTQEKVGKDEFIEVVTYPYAEPKYIKQVLSWVKSAYSLSSERINPSGLNCTNGVLQLKWEGSTPSWELVPHNPSHYYLYKPYAEYNPDAPTEACDRLLKCLDPAQLQIFLRVAAASLDLKRVRRFKGRTIRALFLKGEGRNGKDTLREVVSMLYGYEGISSCTLKDFATYDDGRKFTLYRARFARINWSSENPSVLIDRIQILKAFITGEKISYEGKNKDEEEIEANAVLFFNCNDTPNFTGALEAIKSRFAVLSFDKVFKKNAVKKRGELEEDPRFKYDRGFVQEEILPAFLNYLLQALKDLMAEGIDYGPTEAALEEAKADTNHLYQFCNEVGVAYHPDGEILVGQLWDKLKDWYEKEEIVTYNESGKEQWQEPLRPRDKYVKGVSHVAQRFIELFPKVTRVKTRDGVKLQGMVFLGNPNNLTQEHEAESAIEQGEITNCHTEEEGEIEQTIFESEIASQADLYRAQDFQLHKEVHTGSQEVHNTPQNDPNPQDSSLIPSPESVTVAEVTNASKKVREPQWVRDIKTGELVDISLLEWDDDDDEDLELGADVGLNE